MPATTPPAAALSRTPASLDSLYCFHFELCELRKRRVPYRLQGDGAFDEDEVIQRRNSLASSKRIRSAILQFWTSCGLSLQERMDKETYALVHLSISRALAPELSEAEADASTEEDWLEDAGGAASISFDEFARGLFGIIDMWTSNVDELEYIIFANKLYRRITKLDARPPADAAGEVVNSWRLVSYSMRSALRTYRNISDIVPLVPIKGSKSKRRRRKQAGSQRSCTDHASQAAATTDKSVASESTCTSSPSASSSSEAPPIASPQKLRPPMDPNSNG